MKLFDSVYIRGIPPIQSSEQSSHIFQKVDKYHLVFVCSEYKMGFRVFCMALTVRGCKTVFIEIPHLYADSNSYRRIHLPQSNRHLFLR